MRESASVQKKVNKNLTFITFRLKLINIINTRQQKRDFIGKKKNMIRAIFIELQR